MNFGPCNQVRTALNGPPAFNGKVNARHDDKGWHSMDGTRQWYQASRIRKGTWAGACRRQLKCESLGLKNIHILYWNYALFHQHQPILNKLLYSTDIMALQETCLSDRTVKIAGFHFSTTGGTLDKSFSCKTTWQCLRLICLSSTATPCRCMLSECRLQPPCDCECVCL